MLCPNYHVLGGIPRRLSVFTELLYGDMYSFGSSQRSLVREAVLCIAPETPSHDHLSIHSEVVVSRAVPWLTA